MTITRIQADYSLYIPEPFRQQFTPDQPVVISLDAEGRLIILSLSQLQERLLETFGMWADQTDTPTDGVVYVDQLRQQDRLLRLAEAAADEAN